MKLTQLMVEAGAAGVHFEDQSVFRVFVFDCCGNGVDSTASTGAVDAIDA